MACSGAIPHPRPATDVNFTDLNNCLLEYDFPEDLPCDPPVPCLGDVDRDTVVGFGDLNTVLLNWDCGI